MKGKRPAPASESAAHYGALREQLEKSCLSGGIPSLVEALAHATDTYFFQRFAEIGAMEGEPCTLVAVGGYGRGELCPGSDIDLVLLYEREIPDSAKEMVRRLVYPLWDMGLDVGHGVRTISDCVSLSRKDGKVLSSLLDARPLAGDGSVFRRFVREFEKSVVQKHSTRFAAWLQELNAERSGRFGDSGGLLEPELKNGLGALRDVNQIMWLSRMSGTDGPFLPHELAGLRDDARFLLRVRTALHVAAGRRMDRLAFDLQPEAARLLGFLPVESTPEKAGRAVEFFLSRLHMAMNRILAMREAIFQEVYPRKKQCQVPAGDRGDLVILPSGLGFSSPRSVEPKQALNLFRCWAETGVAPAWQARRAVSENVKKLGRALAHGSETIDTLLTIFLAEHGRAAAIGMAQTGLLSVLVPEFGTVRHLVQFNDYHVHPVGRHTLETVERVCGFIRDPGNRFHDLATGLDNPSRLVLGAFFHDLGKESDNHSKSGARIAEEVLVRFGRSPEEGREVARLVEHHLLVPATATRRDLSDEAVVARVAAVAGTPDMLDKLYLLSVADSMATGPRAWNSWTDSLFNELYMKAASYLKGEFSAPDKADSMLRTWQAVIDAAPRIGPDGLDGAEVERMLEGVPPRAFFALSPETIAHHISLCLELHARVAEDRIRKPSPKGGVGVNVVRAQPARAKGCFEVTVAALARPGLFASIAGALALHNLDILSADIFTWADNVALDVFIVKRPEGGLELDELWARVSRSIMYTLTGKLHMKERLEDKRTSLLARPGFVSPEPPLIVTDNRTSDYNTIIEVAADDRQGLLHDLALALTEAGLSIELARIATAGGRAADIFHVREADGGKVRTEERMAEIRAALQACVA